MTTKRCLIYQIVMMSIMGAFLAGCSGPSLSGNLMDKSPFTGIPCAAPCWHGLVIGESSESDVMSTLPTLTFINQDSVYFHRMSMSGLNPYVYAPGVEITARCLDPDEQCLTLRVVDDILTEIGLVLNYKIRLDQAISYLGDPDHVGYYMRGAEHVTCEIDLVWSSRQLVLASEEFSGNNMDEYCYVVRDTGKTVPSLVISEARYMSVQALDFLLSTGAGEFFEFTGMLSGR